MGDKKDALFEGAGLILTLAGPFGLETPDGHRIAVTSKRGQALLALLATSAKGERTRSWLESMLWCDRPVDQAKASLRKELSKLRKILNSDAASVLEADNNRVWLNLDRIQIVESSSTGPSNQDFLEGLDIAGEEAFEDWLRDRRALAGHSATGTQSSGPTQTSVAADIPQASFAAKPAIAVLPIQLQPHDSSLEFAANGLGEELINRLSRLRWLPVIARSSSFSLGDGPIDPRLAGQRLNAQYIVESTLRVATSPHQLVTNLSDAETGQVLWSDTIVVEDVTDPATIDSLVSGITASLDHQIDQNEQMRAISKQPGELHLLELVWRARWHLVRLSDDDIAAAQDYLDQAATLQPNSPDVLIETAWLNIRRLWLKRASEEETRAARKAAQKAIFADPDDARGHMIAGIAEFWLRQPLRAEGLLRRAVELNPSLVMAHTQLGSALHHKGAREEGIAALETAKRLSPNDFDLFFIEGELAMAHLGEGNLERAVEHAEASLSRRAAYWCSHVAKINALTGLERMDEARSAYRELHRAQPDFQAKYIDWLPYLDVARNAALHEGLNLAAASSD